MPGLSRRREDDIRAGRLESEMRASDLARVTTSPVKFSKPLYKCSQCHTLFEERSRHCPRCDSRTMGEIRPRG